MDERPKNVYFDTSIYNCLLDDSDKDTVLQAIREKNLVVIPSIVNLCELLMSSKPERKKNLIHIYNEIRNDYFPLKPIPWLLKESVENVEKRLTEWKLNYPIDISYETENICRVLKRLKGNELAIYIQGARDFIQDVSKRENLADEFQFFNYIDSQNGEHNLLNLFDQICKSVNMTPQLSRDEKLSIIRDPNMPWKYYFEVYTYLFYRRAFPDKNYGKKSVPGVYDLEQCVYLFWVSKFIIEDDNFIQFVKRLKEIRNYNTEIINYSDFKNYLFS